jgi:hypothetical protein
MNGGQTMVDNLDSIYDAITASQVMNDKPTYAQLVAAMRGCIFLCAQSHGRCDVYEGNHIYDGQNPPED